MYNEGYYKGTRFDQNLVERIALGWRKFGSQSE